MSQVGLSKENWFILNFYNIIRPESGFFKNLITYPVREVEENGFKILIHYSYLYKLIAT